MNRTRRLVQNLLLATAALLLPATPGAGQRVWLVGVDGATWNRLDPLLEAGRLPSLTDLMSRGVHANLATVEPVTSPVVWTSIATGRGPEAHGVTDFLKNSLDVSTPTIFERLAAQGISVGVYDWLVAWPPQALPSGFVVPGWMRRDDATEPPGVLDGLGPSYRYRLRGVGGRDTYAHNVRRELAEKPAEWKALVERHDPRVGALTFYSVDAVSHRFWQDAYPEEFEPGSVPPPDPEYAGLIPEVIEGIDAALGEIAALLDPDDVLIVVSDHGFQAASEFRRVWDGRFEAGLAKAGLVPGRDAFSIEGQFGFGFLRVHSGPFDEREPVLARLREVFTDATNEAGEPLFTVETFDMVERPPEARRPWLERLRQWALGLLLRHWFHVHIDPDAHAHLLIRPNGDVLEAAWPDGRIRFGGQEWALRDVIDADGFSGEHHPTAIFVAAGGPVTAIAERGELSVLDVAPLVLWLAGSPLPDDLEGDLPKAWLSPAALEMRPPRHVAADAIPRLAPPERRSPPGGDAKLIERLRSMGYVE